MTQIVIQPSPKALHHFVSMSAIMTVAVGGFATLFFWRFAHLRPRVAVTMIALTWVVVGVAWLVASALTTKKWHKTNYVFGDDYLTVNKGGYYGSNAQKIYRYDAMISLHVDQSHAGRRHDYGTIRITMPRPEQEVVLPFVPEPERQAVFVKSQIARRGVRPPVDR